MTAYGVHDGRRYHATRCGGAVHVTWDPPRPACRCPDPDTADGVCTACGGSMWECCGRADSEPHRDACHTLADDVGVFVCAGDRWAGSGLPRGWNAPAKGGDAP